MIRLIALIALIGAAGFPLVAAGFSPLYAAISTAPLNDILGTAHVVTDVTFPATLSTNDVCNIVTNEVGGDMWIVSTNGVLVTDWRVSEICTKDDYSPSGKVWEYDIVGPGILYDGRVEPDTSPWRESRIVKQVQEAYGPADAPIGEDVFAVAELVVAPKKNALGLAMAKDVVSAPAITNIVRDNIGTVWDSSLGVAWQARMHNGHLYYIAVTNKQEVAQ